MDGRHGAVIPLALGAARGRDGRPPAALALLVGAFECPVCQSIRHIDDGAEPECCWYCRRPVADTSEVTTAERKRRAAEALALHGDVWAPCMSR